VHCELSGDSPIERREANSYGRCVQRSKSRRGALPDNRCGFGGAGKDFSPGGATTSRGDVFRAAQSQGCCTVQSISRR